MVEGVGWKEKGHQYVIKSGMESYAEQLEELINAIQGLASRPLIITANTTDDIFALNGSLVALRRHPYRRRPRTGRPGLSFGKMTINGTHVASTTLESEGQMAGQLAKAEKELMKETEKSGHEFPVSV